LRELRAVLAVAELGSFRRAAAELGYTQSALSHQVSALEAALGLPLFHRPGGRAQVRLTPAGQAVCRRARRVLSEVEAVAADAEEAERGASVRLRVGVSETAAAEIMPSALYSFRGEHPGVEVVLIEADGTDDNLALQRLVAAGLGHACIGRLAARRAVDPALTWLSPREPLTPRQIVLCYPRGRQMTATALALITAIRIQAS
jgi:DNA-binding transcriptional LysR family regulator